MSSEGHRLHEAHVEGGVEPAGAFTVEPCPAPDGVALIELAGELDIAATSAVRARVDEAAGRRGLVLDLSGATFVDSSMLKELLRASAELARYETRLVLAGITARRAAGARPHAHGRAVHARGRPRGGARAARGLAR